MSSIAFAAGWSGDNLIVVTGSGLTKCAVIFVELVRVNTGDGKLLRIEKHCPAPGTKAINRSISFLLIVHLLGLLFLSGLRGVAVVDIYNQYRETEATGNFIKAASGEKVVVCHNRIILSSG